MEIFAARHVLPISGAPILNGAIVIEGQRIVAVGPANEIKKQYATLPCHEYDAHVLMPGLIDAYTGLDMSLFPQHKIPQSFIAWQAAALSFRQDQSALHRRAAVVEGLQRALANGTTTVADTSHYGKIVETVQQVGLRILAAPEITGTTDPDLQSQYDQTLQQIEQIVDRNAERLRAALAPHSAYALSRNMLKIMGQQAQALNIPIVIQAAASFAEMEFFFESKGEIADVFFPKLGWEDTLPPAMHKTPLQFLSSIGLLGKQTLLVGCSHLAQPDQSAIIESGSHVVHCPATARHFDLGMAPVKKLRKAGTIVALGTGGLGAINNWSLWDTLRAAWQLHHDIPREELAPEDLLRMATLDGARALGWDADIGSLEAGKKADFIIVELAGKPRSDKLALALIQETTPYRLKKVYVDGDCLK